MANHDASQPSGSAAAQPLIGSPQVPATQPGGQVGFAVPALQVENNGFRAPEILRKGMDQVGLFNSLRRRWVLAAGLGLLFAGLAATALWFLVPESSNATALLLVSSERQRILEPIEGAADDTQNYELYAQTQLATVKSDFVLRAALELAEYSIDQKPVLDREDDKVAWLRDHINAQYIRGSEYLEISLTENLDHQDLRDIVNAVTKAYIAEGVVKQRTQSSILKEDLEKAYNREIDTLNARRDSFLTLAKELKTSESNEASVRQRLLVSEVTELDRRIADLEKQRVQAFLNFKLMELSQKDPAFIDAQVQEQLAQDPEIGMFRQQIMLIESQEAQYKTVIKGNRTSPGLAQLQKQKQDLVAQLNQKQQQMRSQISSQLESQPNSALGQTKKAYRMADTIYARQLGQLQTKAEALEKEIMELAEQSAVLASKKAEIENLEALTASMASRLALWNVELNAPNRVRVAQEAKVSPRVNKTTRYFIVGSGGLFMLGLTCFGIGYLEFRNRRLDGPAQMDEGLGIRVIGTLPALSHRRMMRDGDPIVATLMESIDSVRTTLMHDSTAKDRRVVLVTSPEAQEGRTTVASQLAASLARAGRRTLLIDGDVRHPALHGLFDVPLEDGLCEVLRAQVDVDDAIRPTQAEGLWVLTAGYCDIDAMQSLANDQLQPIFDKLRKDYDFVIIDGAPTLGLPDSLILGQYCDGAVLSVLRDRSEVPKIYRAAEKLRGVGVRLVGAVVNGVRAKTDQRITRIHLAPPRAAAAPAETAAAE